MKRHPRLTAAAAALIALPALGHGPSALAAPPEAPTATLMKTVRAKVDADRKTDTVKLFKIGTSRYRLQVITATGKTASAEFTSDSSKEWDTTNVWYGAAHLDGAKGAELIVRRWNAKSMANGDNSVNLSVFTWRKGRLVTERAPASPSAKTWHITGYASQPTMGYHFFNRSGHRYAEVSALKPTKSRWTGTITRSVWKRGHWSKLNSRKVSLRDSAADARTGFSGARLLLGQFKADIDGDAVLDRLVYQRLNDSDFTITITTAKGKVLTRKVGVNDEDPLLGAAALDGVAGDELVFITEGELPVWEVYTWRAGKLAAATPPSMTGESPGTKWTDSDADDTDSLIFSVVDGVHYVTAVSMFSEGGPVCLFEVKSVWEANKWTKLSQRDGGCFANADEAGFTAGIIANFAKP